MKDDLDLLRKYAKNGSQEAFRDLVNRYIPLVWATASRVMGANQSIEEVTQDAFLLLAKRAKSLTESGNVAGWLHRTTYLLALNRRRSEKRRIAKHEQSAQLMAIHTTSNEPTLWQEIEPTLDACIADLPPREQSLLFLRFFRQLRWAQIANLHQVSEGAAKMQVQRTLKKLRQLLLRNGVTVGSLALTSILQANLTTEVGAAQAEQITRHVIEKLPSASITANPFRLSFQIAAALSIAALIPALLWTSSLMLPFQNPLPETANESAKKHGQAPNPFLSSVRNARPLQSQSGDIHTALAALRAAIFDRTHLHEASLKAVESALLLFGTHRNEALPILIEALETPLEPSKRGQVLTDGYYVGKEHSLALHAFTLLGPDASAALDFLLDRLNRDSTFRHSRYPNVIRALEPPSSILPRLTTAMTTHFYVRNAMGRDLGQLIADLAATDPRLSEASQEQLQNFLNQPQPNLRVTAAYTLALMGTPEQERVRLELVSHLLPHKAGQSSPPPTVNSVQDFMKGVMRQTADQGDVEGRRNLAIDGLRALQDQSKETVTALRIIAENSQYQRTRASAFEALNVVRPEIRNQMPALDFYLSDQSEGARLNDLINQNQASEADIIEALQWPRSQLAALEAIEQQGSENSWAIPVLTEYLLSSPSSHSEEIVETLAKIDLKSLLTALQSPNPSVVRRAGSILAAHGPEAHWALSDLKAARDRSPTTIHSIEIALRQIAPKDYQAPITHNILQEVVDLFKQSQRNSSDQQHQALWELLNQYGPRLSGLPKAGVSKLTKELSAIASHLGPELQDRLKKRSSTETDQLTATASN